MYCFQFQIHIFCLSCICICKGAVFQGIYLEMQLPREDISLLSPVFEKASNRKRDWERRSIYLFIDL